jgi:hypothetical protein
MGHDSHTGRMEKRSEDPKSPSPAYRKGGFMTSEAQGCSIDLGDCPVKAPSMRAVAETVVVMLSNPNVQCVIVDRQAGHNPYVLAFSENWNQVRARVEQCESLTKILIVGGPIEPGEEG